MITQKKLNEMKALLGHGYCTSLANRLKEKGVLNSKGKPISADYISQMFMGRITNIEILNTIIDDYNNRKRNISKMNKKIMNLNK